MMRRRDPSWVRRADVVMLPDPRRVVSRIFLPGQEAAQPGASRKYPDAHRATCGATMSDRPRERPHWPPEDGAYDYLDTLSEQEFAWEFLRRNPEYEKDALRAGADKAEAKPLPTGEMLWRLPTSARAATG